MALLDVARGDASHHPHSELRLLQRYREGRLSNVTTLFSALLRFLRTTSGLGWPGQAHPQADPQAHRGRPANGFFSPALIQTRLSDFCVTCLEAGIFELLASCVSLDAQPISYLRNSWRNRSRRASVIAKERAG